ncbi:MAG: hypothetical protein AB1779_04300 [Candidatus Thermoplasmatota archaeon]
MLEFLSFGALTPVQLYVLCFLIGSFAVAALSDIRYMKAQSEFVEIWGISGVVIFLIDLYSCIGSYTQLLLKWSIIALFSFFSHKAIGLYFKLATGDVIACIAAVAILPIIYVIIFFLLLKLCNFFLRPLLRVFGRGDAYPFMPVIFLTTCVIFIFGNLKVFYSIFD